MFKVNCIRFFGMLSILSMSLVTHSGCGPSDQPDLGEVTGTITLDGKPLSGIDVVFQPVSGRPARGKTDADGKYELTYIRQTKGTKIGSNRVEIAPSEDGEAEESAGEEDGKPASKPSKSGKPKIPPKYNVRSELKADVKAGKNTFDFKLES